MEKIEEVFANIDRLFEEKKPAEAENYMLQILGKAVREKDGATVLQMQNELIGYYRQISATDKLKDMIERAIAQAEEMGLADTVPYATTLLNAATGLRSIGELNSALAYYEQVEAIYRKELQADDLRVAGLYNNMSLLYQELGQYEKAEQYQTEALRISTLQNAPFEMGVSCANLANTCVAEEKYSEAREYAGRALEILASRNVFDGHYCAALSALGLCFYAEKQYQTAAEYFSKGMELVLQYVGENAQYKRLKENYEMCMNAMQDKGLVICKKYYETYGAPMIREQFSDYEDRIAVGLVGEGSDCFGYDDAASRDHDWGPGFCMWVSDQTYQEIGARLQEAYEALPTEFMGYRRTESAQGKARRGVKTIGAFYGELLGSRDGAEIDYSRVEDYALAAAVNGEVFTDPEGTFSRIREKIKAGFPEDIRFLKLAEDVAKVSQCGQYNYERMWKRGDSFTADKMLWDCMYHSMRLLHHIENVYPPHDKWLKTSTLQLRKGAELMQICERMYNALKESAETGREQLKLLCGELGRFFADLLYAGDDISDIDDYLAVHVDELLQKAKYSKMSDPELVDAVVKAEFTAFDLVKNEGGRAYCQNDWPTFSVMRKSQYLTWNRKMLLQYLYDFNREFSRGHNLITEKYGRMMESTANEKYLEIKDHFPELGEQKKAVIEQIVAVQMTMMEEFAGAHPDVAANARTLHTYEDNVIDTSYETYLRGEISTYSDKMLQLYGNYVVEKAMTGQNIARQTIENTAKLYGYDDLEAFENAINK